MKQLATITALGLALANPVLADSIVVEVNGVVTKNQLQSGPFASVQVGDTGQLRMEVDLPETAASTVVSVYVAPMGACVLSLGNVQGQSVRSVQLQKSNDDQSGVPHRDALTSGAIYLGGGGLSENIAWFGASDLSQSVFSSIALEAEPGVFPASSFNTNYKVFAVRDEAFRKLELDIVDIRVYELVVGTSYCSGDGSSTACPCGNSSASGEGCSNSTGSGATLTGSGSSRVSSDDLGMHAANMIPGQAALLFAGSTSVNGDQGFPFGDGLRCAGGSIARLGTRATSPSGEASWGPNLASSEGWVPGDTRYLQAYYRDSSGGPCGTGFNTTNGLAVELY